MNIRKEQFLAALMATGLMGATACGDSAEEEVAEEPAPMTTSGAEEPMMEEPMEPMAEEPMEPMEEPMEEEEYEEVGPTPE